MKKLFTEINRCLFEPEIWKDITCYNIKDNTYEISSYGNIRRKEDKYPIKQQILCNEYGYYRSAHFQTNDSGRKTKTMLVHRIVAETFCYKDNELKTQVNHIDNNGLNNYYKNLEWVTPEYNTNYVNQCILSNIEIYNIYNDISNNYNNLEILSKYDMDVSNENIYLLNTIRCVYINNQYIQYDINKIRYNHSLYNNEQIHTMCSLIEKGYNYKQIAEVMGVPLDTRKQRRHFAEYIRQIRSRITFKQISKNYNW